MSGFPLFSICCGWGVPSPAGTNPLIYWMSLCGHCSPCQIQPWLFPGRPGWGWGPGECFLGALHITNGVGTSCGWRNGDGARLGCAPKAQLPPSPGALLGPWAVRGTGLLSALAGARRLSWCLAFLFQIPKDPWSHTNQVSAQQKLQLSLQKGFKSQRKGLLMAV